MLIATYEIHDRLIDVIEVSIPHRDLCSLQPVVAIFLLEVWMFQSLIGIYAHCNFLRGPED